MLSDYIVSCNAYDGNGFYDGSVVLKVQGRLPLQALKLAQEEIITRINNEDLYTSSTYEKIRIYDDDDNTIRSFRDFVIREYGYSNGYVVQYVIDCATGNDTIALVYTQDLVPQYIADEESGNCFFPSEREDED